MNTNIPGLAALIGNNPSYLLAIMWKDENENTFRYALWNGVGEVIDFTLPLYAGQLIKKNFRLEAWSVSGQAIALNTLNLAFLTSVLQGVDYRYSQDAALQNPDPIVTQFGCSVNPPSGQFPNSILSLDSRFIASTGIFVNNYAGAGWNDIKDPSYPVGQNEYIGMIHNEGIQVVQTKALNVQQIVASSDDAFGAAIFNVNPAHAFYLVNFTGNVTTGCQFYSYGGPVTTLTCGITTLDSTHVTLILEDGSTLAVPTNRWIILDICYNTGKSRITYYDFYNQTPTPQPYPIGFNNSTTTTTNGRWFNVYGQDTAGFSPGVLLFSLAEILWFNTYIGASNTQLVLTYFNAQYNFNFPVPLVFPTNSTPLPN